MTNLTSVSLGAFIGNAVIYTAAGPNPVVNYNFVNGNTTLPSDLTFTRASNATYYNSAGVLTTAANNVLRFDYNPSTRALNGLLLESASTNINPVSNPSTWGLANTAIAPNSTIAPDGTLTAPLITDLAVSSVHFVYSGTAASATTTYTISAYVKQATGRYMCLSFTSAGIADAFFITVDTQTGTITNSGAIGGGTYISSTIRVINNGWYCVSVTGITSGASWFVVASNTNASNATPATQYLGTGTGVYVWGGQAEQQNFASSPILTSLSPATRANETLIASSIPWFNANAGTIVFNFMFEAVNQPSTAPVYEFDDGTGNNRFVCYMPASSTICEIIIASGGTNTFIQVSNNLTANTVYSVGLSYSSSGYAACINGGSVITGTSGLPTGISELTIGNILQGPSGNIWARSLEYWNYQFSPTQLQQAT
jgi:hypothetical protein